jgi:hypothetical protein
MKGESTARFIGEEPTWHVDDFIDSPDSDPYASWIFMHYRLPAWQKIAYTPFMKNHKLFCTYKGERYRVTGASTLGDVWLSKDFNREDGYELRGVLVAECSNWGKNP